MEKHVFITSEFNRIDKRRWPIYITDYLENPDVSSLHRDGGKIMYKKFNTDAYPRLLFFEEVDKNGNVLYIPRKYFCEHREYDRFRQLSYKEQLQRAKYVNEEESEVNRMFEKLVEKRPKPKLLLEMRDIEGLRDFSNTSTTYVFEMDEWCSHFNNKEFADDKREIYETVQNIVINKKYGEPDADGWIVSNFSGNKELVFRVHNSSGHTFFYLFDIVLSVNKEQLNNKYIDLSDLRLLKQARKGYPDWILCSEFEDWKKLENDDEANLALSDEEVDVLNNTPYPYFINGLAGSGKSTILYYLFAHAYSYKATRSTDLIFLSYSKKLIVKAKQVIKSLLQTNPSYNGFNLTKDEEAHLDECFWSFQDFLKKQFIVTEEEITRFSSNKHMNYELFQKKFETEYIASSGNSSYKAAMVWSVIRTFIKGRDYRAPFTIEQYQALPKSDRTVDAKDYENIYKIWKSWYKQKYETEYWDDLDLVGYVLKKIDSGIDFAKYDIIYCDEVQDFTPIENRLIIKLSKYSYYDLSDYLNIPIAYAGDPNQTVNPTGFSWKRLKEIFDNSFEELIGSHISLKECSLNNNYRSKRTIVEFANSLQYIRKCFLTDDTLYPQDQWNPQANPLPGFFFLNTEEDKKLIETGFDKTECIITGADGEYEKMLDEDKLTEESTEIDDELLLRVNKTKLYTAISSKGLEFKAVILYKFADHLPKCFAKIVNGEEIIDESDRYDLAHFFTKIYIAVSRAKEILYIADTQENYDQFWKYFVDNKFVNDLLSSRTDSISWDEKVGGIELGSKDEYLHRLTENFNPLETAQKIYEDAKLSRDSKNMNRAAGYYEEGGDYTKTEECKSYVLLFEKKYLEAGNKFRALNLIDQATKAYWNGLCWDELEVYGERLIYRMTAKFMLGKISLIEFVDIENIIDSIKYTDETWKQVVIKISSGAASTSSEYIFTVCEFLENLVDRGFVFLNGTIANLYYKNKKYKKAIEKWDSLNKTNHKLYYESKEQISKDSSEKIYWMNLGSKHDQILKEYSEPELARVLELDQRARRVIFSLLLKPATFDKALNYPVELEDRLNQLYRTDRVKFIQEVVLKDFTDEKFFVWVEDRLSNYDSDLFSIILPASFFDAIFALPTMDEWIKFMRLTDNDGYRVMRNSVNINTIADSVSNALTRKNYISLASCFLDVVFNNPNYNYANANKYVDTVVRIFEQNEFYKADFRAATKHNTYFDKCELKVNDVEYIRDRLNKFARVKIESYKKIKPSDFSTVKILCRIYEKTTQYKQKEDSGKYVYDFTQVIDFYNSLCKNKQHPEELVSFFTIRKIVIMAQCKERYTLHSLNKDLSDKFTYGDLITSFDKEDAVWFVKFTVGRQKLQLDKIKSITIDIARLIYKYDIKIREYDSTVKNYIRKNSEIWVAESLTELMSQPRVDTIAIKTLTYVWEMAVETHQGIADKYDTLSANQRFVKITRLVDYLHVRALHHFAYCKESMYNQKAKEYELNYSIQTAKEFIRPKIEDKSDEHLPQSTTKKVIVIDNDTKIGDIDIELKQKRKTIWFSKGGIDLVTIEHGKITDNNEQIKIEGSAFSLDKNMRVNILSENLCVILYDGIIHEIRL